MHVYSRSKMDRHPVVTTTWELTGNKFISVNFGRPCTQNIDAFGAFFELFGPVETIVTMVNDGERSYREVLQISPDMFTPEELEFLLDNGVLSRVWWDDRKNGAYHYHYVCDVIDGKRVVQKV